MERRSFLKLGLGTVSGGLVLPSVLMAGARGSAPQPPFKISLAQWSLNKGFFGRVEPKLDPLDFAKLARKLDIEGLEYVNQFFKDKARDRAYLSALKQRAEDHGCRSLLIMCDGEGNLGDPDDAKRSQAVENHIQWLEAARFLGCHSIRVNAHSQGSFAEQQKRVIDGLGRLCERGQSFGLNVVVENHGGLSSDPDWLVGVMEGVGLPNVGTLPDFGNFGEHDPYRGVELLMPFAKGVSAKASFNADGTCRTVDYPRMMRIVRDAGWNGYVGIESGAGNGFSEMDAIGLTRKLLDRELEHWYKTPPILGDSLQGWQKIEGGDWEIEDGVLIGTNGRNWSTNTEVSGSWLYHREPVRDFRLEFQYMINERGNSGVLFRSQLAKNPSFTGYEMQITASQNPVPNPKGTPGAVYDFVTPAKNAARGPGQWNTVTIIGRGPKIVIEMNHERIVDATLDRSLEGYLGFQNHDTRSVVKFKNVRLQRL
jgi:sugar phosphate isomerase/epimerase